MGQALRDEHRDGAGFYFELGRCPADDFAVGVDASARFGGDGCLGGADTKEGTILTMISLPDVPLAFDVLPAAFIDA